MLQFQNTLRRYPILKTAFHIKMDIFHGYGRFYKVIFISNSSSETYSYNDNKDES